MAMVVKNNMSAINTLNTLNKNQSALSKSLAKVSSGMKINSAQDDASGYAISERMRVMVRSLDQANQNTQNGSSMMKVAEGAVANTVEILRTLKQKAINAATDTNTDDDRKTIQKEIDQFVKQIDDNALITFNGKYLLDGSKTQRADYATSSALTNQQLAENTSGTTKLTDLMSRYGNSLLIQKTDMVQASFVMNGKTYTTQYTVMNTTLQDVFKALNAVSSDSGVTAFGNAALSDPAAKGEAEVFKTYSEQDLINFANDVKLETDSDQIIADANAYLSVNSLSSAKTALKSALEEAFSGLTLKGSPAQGQYIVFDSSGFASGTANAAAAQTIDVAYRFTGTGLSDATLRTYANQDPTADGVSNTAILTTMSSNILKSIENLANNIVIDPTTYSETSLTEAISRLAGSIYVLEAKDFDPDDYDDSKIGSSTSVYLQGVRGLSLNGNESLMDLSGVSSEIEDYMRAYLAARIASVDTADAEAVATQTVNEVDDDYEGVRVDAGITGNTARDFATAYASSSTEIFKMIAEDDLSAYMPSQDLWTAAVAFSAAHSVDDAYEDLIRGIADAVGEMQVQFTSTNLSSNIRGLVLSVTDDGDADGVNTDTKFAEILASETKKTYSLNQLKGWNSSNLLSAIRNSTSSVTLQSALRDYLAGATLGNVSALSTNTASAAASDVYNELQGVITTWALTTKLVSQDPNADGTGVANVVDPLYILNKDDKGDRSNKYFGDGSNGQTLGEAFSGAADALVTNTVKSLVTTYIQAVVAEKVASMADYDAIADTHDNGLVYSGIEIGRNASQDMVKTADGTIGLTVTAGTAGMDYQIAGLAINIMDSNGQNRTAVNEFLNAFKTTIFASNASADNTLKLHTGAEASQSISVSLDDMRSQALGLKGLDNSIVSVANVTQANAAISVFDTALQKALDIQTTIGAIEARLEYTSDNLSTSSENVQAAESTIRDADMAKEMTEYTKNNVLLQAAQSMLAQANQNSSAVLSLLQ